MFPPTVRMMQIVRQIAIPIDCHSSNGGMNGSFSVTAVVKVSLKYEV